MRLRILLRLSLTVIFGFIGSLVARGATPPEIFGIFGDYFLIFAIIAFGLLGLILLDILELAGKAGIAALAKQIVSYLPSPGVRLTKRSKKRWQFSSPLVVDTSVLIDGRLTDIARAGFVPGTLVVVQSVIEELHRLSDSSDDLKRAKGRRGLDCLKAIKEIKRAKLEVLEIEPEIKEVDSELIRIAKKLKGKIVTVDFNLSKVAKVKGIDVLNINELASAVKTAALPGEMLKVQIISKGRKKSQGVGYLADGTMVVVERGADLKGKVANVLVHKVLQKEAGKMIFAKPANLE